jgi:hypothetical protein
MAATQPVKPVTLTQVAGFARIFNIVAAIVLGSLIVGRFFLTSFTNYWAATHPAPPPPPQQGFGILPTIVFPESAGTPVSYKLEVPPRKLQPQADRANVYFMPSQRASLLALDRAKKQAQSLGFLLEPEQITSEVYRWTHTQPLRSILDYNTSNGTFTMRLDWQSDPTFLQTKQLPDEDGAISLTRSLLSGAGLLEKDIATGSAKVTYLKASANGYAPTVSLSESDFLQVDIFRTKIDGIYDVVTDTPDHGTVRSIITGNNNRELRYAVVEYRYLPVDYTAFSDYPIITPSQAFELLKTGRGYTAQMPEGQTDIVIRDLKLAYFDNPKHQEYLQPVYVLEGDGGYIGYVAAIQTITR